MADKQHTFTDNEIIKALECCVTYEFCTGCPLVDNCPSSYSLLKSALDLINRQKAEIERLFDREQAEQELYEKMLSELQAFRESLLKLTPADIIGNYNPYELIYKEDLLMCFEDDELCLTDGDIQLLLGMDKPLDWLYQSWCDSSISHMDMLHEFIRNTVQTQEAHND